MSAPSADGHRRLTRLTILAAVAAIVVASIPASASAGGAIPAGLHARLPAPVAHADPVDVPSPLDLAAASFGQTGPRFELRIRVAGPLPLRQMAEGKGRSLCLLVEQRRPARSQRLCLTVSATGRLSLVESRRRTSGAYGAPHTITARLRRTGADAILATFTPAAAGLTHGRVVWRVHAEWLDDASCPAPAAGAESVCHDALPDHGGVAARVHAGYVVGCIPDGASLRTSGPRTARRVALTFDDGPGPQTPDVLRILKQAHVPATFFVLGVQLQLYPQSVRRAVADGHAIGSHTWHHPTMTGISPAAAAAELARTSAAIEQTTRYRPCLFRPPGGGVNGTVVSLARRQQMLSILWDVDPRDWARPGTDAIVRNVLRDARPGSIILFHDGGGPRSQTLAALPRIIAGLRTRHLTFVTLPTLLGLAPVIAWD